MRKSVLPVAIAMIAALASFPSEARAQWQPFDGKLIVNVNFGGQFASEDITRSSTFSLYDEEAQVEVVQSLGSSGFFEVGGALKVRGNFGVGVSYGFTSASGDGVIDGSLPHPLNFDSPRSFSAGAEGLDHAEHAVHMQAIWFIPFTEKVDFTVSAGPSIFNVKQDLIRTVFFSENPPTYTSVTIDSVDVVQIKDSGWGFNIGADVTYALTRAIGVGGLIRYARGNVEFNLSDEQTQDVKAGGFQIAAGVRLKF